MDALLLALLACLACEFGGRGPLLTLALATRFRRDGAVLAGLAVASAANAALGAAAGVLVGRMIGGDARTLFLALAFLFAGVAMAPPARAPDPLATWRTGPFLTSALGLFILGFGESAQFLIMGIAARMGDPVLAAAGGAAGVLIAGVPVVPMRADFFTALPVRPVRTAGAGLFVLVGIILALGAAGLL
jgi:putative Ca2+/H+ antiporter (TMEM165/GDT1 family)